jgi:putative phage-type endonuclease
MSTDVVSPLVDRQAWLEERRKGIGASEAAAALGLDPYRSPLELWALKTGRIQPQAENEAMRLGLLLEPVLAGLYQGRGTQTITEQQVFVRHPELPLFATLDAVNSDGVIVEFKTINERRAAKELGEDGTDEVPESWVVQAHQQMIVAGRDQVDFAVLVGGQHYREFTVCRSSRLVDTIVPRLVGFWGLVEADEPPPFVTADAAVLQAIYAPTGDEIEGDDELRALVDEYEELGRAMKVSGDERDQVKAAILARLEGRNASLPDGRRIKQSTTTARAYSVAERTYSTMRILKAKG